VHTGEGCVVLWFVGGWGGRDSCASQGRGKEIGGGIGRMWFKRIDRHYHCAGFRFQISIEM